MGHTLAEKIIMKHIGGKSVKPGDLVVVEPDCVVIHDIYTAFLQDKMKKMGLTKVWNTDKIVIMHDHLMPACLEGDPRSLEAGYELVKEYGIRHFHATGGIVHQLVPELRCCRLLLYRCWIHRNGSCMGNRPDVVKSSKQH